MKIVEKVTQIISVLLLSSLIILIFLQIALRELGVPMTFAGELSMILLSWMGFISAAYSMRNKGHVAVEFFVEKFPIRIRHIIQITTNLLLIIFLAYLTYQSWNLAGRQMNIPFPNLGIPRGVAFYSLPAGTFIMTLFVVENTYMEVKALLKKR